MTKFFQDMLIRYSTFMTEIEQGSWTLIKWLISLMIFTQGSTIHDDYLSNRLTKHLGLLIPISMVGLTRTKYLMHASICSANSHTQEDVRLISRLPTIINHSTWGRLNLKL